MDAHGDINTPTKSESRNIHGMPLAFLTGPARGEQEDVSGWIKDEHWINVKKLVYIGLGALDEAGKKGNQAQWN